LAGLKVPGSLGALLVYLFFALIQLALKLASRSSCFLIIFQH
jgi:hypothetical protein